MEWNQNTQPFEQKPVNFREAQTRAFFKRHGAKAALIAIIAVLVGLASIAASSLLAALRQNKLDTIAQDIYVTAQNRLTEMYTDNRADQISVAQLTKTGGSTAGLFTMAVDNGAVKPSDWEPKITYAGLDAMYNKQAPAADILLPEGLF